MAFYSYKAANQEGKVIKGVVEAESPKDAVLHIRELGYIPIKVLPHKSFKNHYLNKILASFKFGSKKVPHGELLSFTEDFAFLLKSGLPVDKSLSIEVQILENQALCRIVRDVLKRVQAGSYLSEALKAHSEVFSQLYVNMVKTGESAGMLAYTLERLADLMKEAHEMRSHIISSLVYPVFVLIVSGLSIVILLTYVIPRFSVIFADLGQAIPLPTRFLLWLSEETGKIWPFLIGGSLALGYFTKRYIATEQGREKVDGYKLRIPILGKAIVAIEISRFARTLGVLLRSGVPIIQALLLAENTLKNQVIRIAMKDVVEKVKKGDTLSKSLRGIDLVPPLAFQMIVIGEETGDLERMLLRVAEHYEKNVKYLMKRVISLIEPGIILLMGLLVGFIVISMLLGIFSINELPF